MKSVVERLSNDPACHVVRRLGACFVRKILKLKICIKMCRFNVMKYKVAIIFDKKTNKKQNNEKQKLQSNFQNCMTK